MGLQGADVQKIRNFHEAFDRKFLFRKYFHWRCAHSKNKSWQNYLLSIFNIGEVVEFWNSGYEVLATISVT